MIHKDLECQFKQLAKIMIVDALGTDDEIIRALPYTQIHFDQPVIANALERSQIGKFHSETVFNYVSARLPIDIAVEMADKNVASDMRTNAEILEKLQEIQSKGDAQDEERINLELEQREADIEQTEAQINATKESIKLQKTVSVSEGTSNSTTAVGKKQHSESSESSTTKGKSPAQYQREKALSDKTEKNYTRLQQRQHEKTRVGSTKRSEKLARARGRAASI
jgi:hypothetical protein